MKKTLLFLYVSISGITSAQTWEDVGLTNITSIYANTNLETDGESLFLSCNNSSLDLYVSVYTFMGGAWNLLGDSSFARGQQFNSETLTAMNGSPYVISQDDTGHVIVMRYDGNDWVMVGEPLTVEWGKSLSITNDNDILYAGFYDFSQDGVVVKKWNGSAWEFLGGGSITTGISNYVSLHVENNVVYLACQENNALMVFRYEESAWENLGLQPVSSGYASNMDIAVEDSVVMVMYENDDNFGEIVVISYENGLWNQVGASTMPYVGGLHTNMTLLYHNPLIQFRQLDGVQSVMYYQNGVWDYVGQPFITSGPATGCDLLVDGSDVYISYRDIDLEDTIFVKKFVDPLVLNEQSLQSISVYPNPCSSDLHIQTSNGIELVECFDLSGRRVFSDTKNHLDISALPKGCYTLIITTDRGMLMETLVKE